MPKTERFGVLHIGEQNMKEVTINMHKKLQERVVDIELRLKEIEKEIYHWKITRTGW